MIFILYGNDTKKKNSQIKVITKNREVIFTQTQKVSKELIDSYVNNTSLFGDSPVIVFDNLLNSEIISFSDKELVSLNESPAVFIFTEDKLLAKDEKRYTKYAKIEKFEQKEGPKIPAINIFSIADSFAKKDKIGTWVLYCKCIDSGIDGESISGILFWKVKTMILTGSKVFTKEQLKIFSSQIISIYHKAHRGDMDFAVGLEQFILSSLSK